MERVVDAHRPCFAEPTAQVTFMRRAAAFALVLVLGCAAVALGTGAASGGASAGGYPACVWLRGPALSDGAEEIASLRVLPASVVSLHFGARPATPRPELIAQ